jgi:hypothetical protein
LQFSVAGTISGTPSTAGTAQLTFTVTESSTPVRQTASIGPLPLTISPAVQPLSVAPITLPPGVVNQAYPVTTLTATGGVQPYTWSPVVIPALPNGLQFNVASPGTISGTPLNGTAGTTTHTFTVMDTSTPVSQTSSSGPLSLTITSAVQPLLITTNSLTNARVNHNYSFQLQRSGGTAPFTWSISSPPPQGLQFSATGVISGTPATGTGSLLGTKYTRTYTVQDSSNPKQSNSKSLDLTITN